MLFGNKLFIIRSKKNKVTFVNTFMVILLIGMKIHPARQTILIGLFQDNKSRNISPDKDNPQNLEI